MDGERMAPVEALVGDRSRHERRDFQGATAPRPKTIRWLVIVGLLLAIVLGGLYGFNRFRAQAIATYFANSKPPPAHVSAAEVKTEAVPRFATGIGSLAAVHQVTVTPEVGGRVTKIFFTAGASIKADEPLVQINDEPDRGDLANYQAQARFASVTLTRKAAQRERERDAEPHHGPDDPHPQLFQVPHEGHAQHAFVFIVPAFIRRPRRNFRIIHFRDSVTQQRVSASQTQLWS